MTITTIYIDTNGTSIGNESLSDEDAAWAISRLAARFRVVSVSASPSEDQWDKAVILDGPLSGSIFIDDAPEIRAIAARKGAIAVPANQLGWLASALGKLPP